ncbi:tetratricopeptide repeat protein [Undibacterium sp.]|jgi:tetratricopeptide (TPR) repeat protein|uniref:tetratricopeptide repeat protein n=1 Tax=Undibacterium sp. TaxID=1914977 RepID=UPI002C9B283D|nr:tetratricopeptide repeat protein [Undibacterium sp.]HTD04397.1 tetratricopeptide repeat protein [Undibacterium sp.]
MTRTSRNLGLLALLAVSGISLAAVDKPVGSDPAASLVAPAKPGTPSAAKNSPEYEQAVAALKNKQWDLAEKLFKQAALKQPRSPLPLIGQAEVARLKKNDGEAIRLLRKAVDIDPKSAQSHLILGAVYHLQGNWTDSERELLKAAELAPQSPTPLLALADLYFNSLRNPAKGAEYFGKVIKLQPDYAPAYLGLGMSYMALKDNRNAAPALEKARALAPNNPLPLMAQSQLQMSEGNIKGAISALQEAGKLAPTMEEIPLRLGMYYQQDKQWAEAYASYETALRLNDKLVVAYNNLAWMAADRKERLDDAERWGAKAVQLFPNEPSLKDTYAWVKRARGDNKAALGMLESITSSGNPTAEYFYHLGVVREESGQKVEAVTAYKRALQINPNFGQADDIRQRLAKLD